MSYSSRLAHHQGVSSIHQTGEPSGSRATDKSSSRPSPLLPSPPNSPPARPTSTYASPHPNHPHSYTSSYPIYAQAPPPSSRDGSTPHSFDSEPRGSSDNDWATPPYPSTRHNASVPAPSHPSWTRETQMAEEVRRFGRSVASGDSAAYREWNDSTYPYATVSQEGHYTFPEDQAQRPAPSMEQLEEEGQTAIEAASSHDHSGRHLGHKYDYYPPTSSASGGSYRAFNLSSDTPKFLHYGVTTSAEARNFSGPSVVPSHSPSHLTYEALCAPGLVLAPPASRNYAYPHGPSHQHYTHLAPMLEQPSDFSPKEHAAGDHSSREQHEGTPDSFMRDFDEKPDYDKDGSLSSDYPRDEYSPSPPASFSIFDGKVKRPPKKLSRSATGMHGASRPISPITGRPTKLIAKRAYPPRDAAKRYYFCSEAGCGKSFGRPSARDTHMRSHNGEQPFVCPIVSCARAFSVFSNLKRHMVVHPEVDFRGVTVHDLPRLFNPERMHQLAPIISPAVRHPPTSSSSPKRKKVNDDDEYCDDGTI